MIQSFIVYTLFAASLVWLGIISAKRERIYLAEKKKLYFWVWDIVLALLIFALVSGIRWQVGVDHLNYLEGYNDVKLDSEFLGGEIEIGFRLITELFAKLNIHFVFYFAFWAFLQIFFIYRSFKDERYLLPYLGLLIIFGGEYLSWMNGIRQMLAATIFVFSIQFINQKKIILYIITILFASLFHKSAVFLLIFYFFSSKNIFKNRYLNIGLLLFAVIIGKSPTFVRSLDFFLEIFEFTGHDRYAEAFEKIQFYTRETKFGPRPIIRILINIIIIWHATNLKKVFSNTNFLIYFNLNFLGILLHSLLINTNHVYLRPISYLTIFLPITIAYLLYYLKKQTPSKGVSIKFLMILLVSSLSLVLAIIADYGAGTMDWSNFKFFWDFI